MKISHTKGQEKPDVIVTFLNDGDEELKKLTPKDPIKYSARLVAYGGKDGGGQEGFAFTLVDGKLEKE